MGGRAGRRRTRRGQPEGDGRREGGGGCGRRGPRRRGGERRRRGGTGGGRAGWRVPRTGDRPGAPWTDGVIVVRSMSAASLSSYSSEALPLRRSSSGPPTPPPAAARRETSSRARRDAARRERGALSRIARARGSIRRRLARPSPAPRRSHCGGGGAGSALAVRDVAARRRPAFSTSDARRAPTPAGAMGFAESPSPGRDRPDASPHAPVDGQRATWRLTAAPSSPREASSP